MTPVAALMRVLTYHGEVLIVGLRRSSPVVFGVVVAQARWRSTIEVCKKFTFNVWADFQTVS